MWKAVLAGTAALAIAGSSVVYAQRHRGPDAGVRGQVSQEDAAAFADARIAALKAGLRLSPEQEKNWPAFESAVRDMAKSRQDRRAARSSEQRPTDPVERLRRQADALSGAGASLKRLADAEEPLYKSLDDAQKQRFHTLARMLAPRQMRFAGQRNRGERKPRGEFRQREGQGGPALQGTNGASTRNGG